MCKCYFGLTIFYVVYEQETKQEAKPSCDAQQNAGNHLRKHAGFKSQGQGPYLPNKDPIPDLPIVLTQCQFMQCLEIFGFLQQKNPKTFILSEKNWSHYHNFNTHTNSLNSLDMFEDRGWGFGLDSGLWGFISGPLQSVRLLCRECLHGGQVKPVSPICWHCRFAPQTGKRWGGGGHGKSSPSCSSSLLPQQLTCFVVYADSH